MNIYSYTLTFKNDTLAQFREGQTHQSLLVAQYVKITVISFRRFVLRLQESDGIGDIGGISLKNVICLLFAWIIIFFCLIKGIKSSGKVVYFTATFPYVLLIVLLVRGVTLPGYYEGVKFYIIPKWEELKNVKVNHFIYITYN